MSGLIDIMFEQLNEDDTKKKVNGNKRQKTESESFGTDVVFRRVRSLFSLYDSHCPTLMILTDQPTGETSHHDTRNRHSDQRD